MSKRMILLILFMGTVFSIGRMVCFNTADEPVTARVEQVKRRNVHQVIPITGRLAYTDEKYIYAQTSGKIKRICTDKDQRIDQGELLVCLDSRIQDQITASVYDLPGKNIFNAHDAVETMTVNSETVIRSPYTCTIRQMMVEEGMYIPAGMPVCRVSSNQQQIICTVMEEDAKQIEVNNWAWIISNHQPVAKGVIIEVERTDVLENTSDLLTKVCLIPDHHIDLPEGAVLDVDVYVAGSNDVLSLPLEAITERETVWWINEGRCTEIPAQIVLCDEMYAWVDLPEGMTIAVGEFNEGQPVLEAAE